MKKNSEKEILYSYLRECNSIYTYASNDVMNSISSIIENIIPFEKPDMYSVMENELVIIEHFEFDSYNNSNKKGSDYRRKESNIKEEFNKIVRNTNKNEISYNDKIESTASRLNYINNFIRTFDDHYEKIETYEKNLECYKIQNLNTYFFIEDSSPLGSYFINNNRQPRNLLIFQFEEIFTFLLKHKKVKVILYGFFDGNKKRLILLENKKRYIGRLLKDYEIVVNQECYWLESNITGFSFKVAEINETK